MCISGVSDSAKVASALSETTLNLGLSNNTNLVYLPFKKEVVGRHHRYRKHAKSASVLSETER
jgi:hypothetical protein